MLSVSALPIAFAFIPELHPFFFPGRLPYPGKISFLLGREGCGKVTIPEKKVHSRPPLPPQTSYAHYPDAVTMTFLCLG